MSTGAGTLYQGLGTLVTVAMALDLYTQNPGTMHNTPPMYSIYLKWKELLARLKRVHKLGMSQEAPFHYRLQKCLDFWSSYMTFEFVFLPISEDDF